MYTRAFISRKMWTHFAVRVARRVEQQGSQFAGDDGLFRHEYFGSLFSAAACGGIWIHVELCAGVNPVRNTNEFHAEARMQY